MIIPKFYKTYEPGITFLSLWQGNLLLRMIIDWDFKFGLQCGWSLVLGSDKKFEGYRTYFLTFYLLNINCHVGFLRKL